MRVIIVDDEPGAINSLIWELQKFSEYIKVVDTFTSAYEALSGINYLKPDCIFLDIEMPEMSGFTLLQKLTYRDFAVVITTAYSQYAIQAIKESALDYLLKPIDGDEIKLVIDKLKRTPVNGKIIFLKISDIVYCESDGNYSKVFLESSKELYVSKKLKELEGLLPDNHFFRVHNSYIIHMLKVIEYLRSEGYVVLSNHKKIPVSRNKRQEFLNKMAF